MTKKSRAEISASMFHLPFRTSTGPNPLSPPPHHPYPSADTSTFSPSGIPISTTHVREYNRAMLDDSTLPLVLSQSVVSQLYNVFERAGTLLSYAWRVDGTRSPREIKTPESAVDCVAILMQNSGRPLVKYSQQGHGSPLVKFFRVLISEVSAQIVWAASQDHLVNLVNVASGSITGFRRGNACNDMYGFVIATTAKELHLTAENEGEYRLWTHGLEFLLAVPQETFDVRSNVSE
jgi:hypothetical protein